MSRRRLCSVLRFTREHEVGILHGEGPDLYFISELQLLRQPFIKGCQSAAVRMGSAQYQYLLFSQMNDRLSIIDAFFYQVGIAFRRVAGYQFANKAGEKKL